MKLKNGIYLIIDPAIDRGFLVNRLKEIISEKIVAVQIWDNFHPLEDSTVLINELVQLCHASQIPVLINNQWELLKCTELDGIHFDLVPENIQQIKREIDRDIITGITCTNDLSVVKWANRNGIDYLSFCSMFPSSTANSCELVDFETVKEARKLTAQSIFLAGGIKPDNIERLDELDYSGIAVVSGIMNTEKPLEEIEKYYKKIKSQSK